MHSPESSLPLRFQSFGPAHSRRNCPVSQLTQRSGFKSCNFSEEKCAYRLQALLESNMGRSQHCPTYTINLAIRNKSNHPVLKGTNPGGLTSAKSGSQGPVRAVHAGNRVCLTFILSSPLHLPSSSPSHPRVTSTSRTSREQLFLLL